jgi:hypothetical protein
MCLQFGLVIFWRKNFGAKAAHKMLVKLTPGDRIWLLIYPDFLPPKLQQPNASFCSSNKPWITFSSLKFSFAFCSIANKQKKTALKMLQSNEKWSGLVFANLLKIILRSELGMSILSREGYLKM